MKLLYTPTSPYARKVRIALLEKGLRCELIFDNPTAPDTAIPTFNPLGKVPTLIVEAGDPLHGVLSTDGDVVGLFDSPVLVQYLEAAVPMPALLPTETGARLRTLRWEALCDGLCDAVVAIVLERRRAVELQDGPAIERQLEKARRALAAADDAVRDAGEGALVGGQFGLAEIALVAALGYVELRAPALLEPRLSALAGFRSRYEGRESVRATEPPRA